jgi:hypothetical protein
MIGSLRQEIKVSINNIQFYQSSDVSYNGNIPRKCQVECELGEFYFFEGNFEKAEPHLRSALLSMPELKLRINALILAIHAAAGSPNQQLSPLWKLLQPFVRDLNRNILLQSLPNMHQNMKRVNY